MGGGFGGKWGKSAVSGEWSLARLFFLVGVFGVLDVMVVDVEDYIDVYEEVL